MFAANQSLGSEIDLLFEANNALQQQILPMLDSVLDRCYADGGVPTGASALLLDRQKPGNVLAVFYYGRSGSYLLGSFFNSKPYARIMAVPNEALISLERDQVTEAHLDQINNALNEPAIRNLIGAVSRWVDSLAKRLPKLVASDDGAVHLSHAQLQLFKEVLALEIASHALIKIDYEQLLKCIFLAYRVSRGEALDCTQAESLTYVWQAHVPLWPAMAEPSGPQVARREWLHQRIPGLLSLTVVRLPEKALDSHLVHHAVESPLLPLATLVRRLIFEMGIASTSEMIPSVPKDRQGAVRFEDLHEHTETVLRAVCSWAGMEFDTQMLESDYSFDVRGREVKGTRRIGMTDLTPFLLSSSDVVRVRRLLRNEYIGWGYMDWCITDYEASLNLFERIQDMPISCHRVLATIDGSVGDVDREETVLRDLFSNESERRSQGFQLLPLLVSPGRRPKLATDD